MVSLREGEYYTANHGLSKRFVTNRFHFYMPVKRAILHSQTCFHIPLLNFVIKSRCPEKKLVLGMRPSKFVLRTLKMAHIGLIYSSLFVAIVTLVADPHVLTL